MNAFQPLGLASENIHTLNGLAQDPHKEAARYEALIQKLKVDLAFLGIGPGGHIGFNEANTSFSSITHLAQLSSETVRRDKERAQDTPGRALTQGISTILRAQHHILVAYGHEKGTILREALYGEISPKVPASALRKVGKSVMFVDESAGMPSQDRLTSEIVAQYVRRLVLNDELLESANSCRYFC